MHIHNDKIANMLTLLYSDDDDYYLILFSLSILKKM